MGKIYPRDNPKLVFIKSIFIDFMRHFVELPKQSEYSILHYESIHHNSFLKRQQEFSVHFKMLQLTSFSPKRQHSLGVLMEKKLLLH